MGLQVNILVFSLEHSFVCVHLGVGRLQTEHSLQETSRMFHLEVGRHEWSDAAAAAAHHKRFLNKENGNRKLLALLMKICKTLLDDSADFLVSHNFIDIMPHDVKLRVITLPLHPNHSNTNHNYKGLDNDINIWLWHCLPSKLSPHKKL